MAWRANANRAGNGAASTAAAAAAAGASAAHGAPVGATPSKSHASAAAAAVAARNKPTIQAIAQIEKNREDRRRAMAAAKKERQIESQMNEKMGQPGDVDFQRMIRGFREQNSGKKQPHAPAGETKITICVRKRPVNAKEVKKRDYDAVTCLNPMAIVHDCKLKVDGITKYLDSNAFSFDHTFDEATSSEVVYNYTARPLVNFVFKDRGRATVFAYGQTGSGKTHTMQGIQKQIAADVFDQVHAFEKRGATLDVWVSFFEIYGGRCQDLLRRKRLTIREDGTGEVQIVDLEEVQPRSTEELLQIIHKGNSLRTTHATEMNDVSSRSHCICQISIRERGSAQLYGKLSLIDLAGSERGEDTKNHNRQRRMESSEVNKSLLALKECFRALDSGGRGTHIPFRASKLTQVLKDSFVNAKARTVMIAAVSPCSSSSDHTVNTLRYADRVKEKHVSADAFEEGSADSVAVDLNGVNFETDAEDGAESPMRSHRDDLDDNDEPFDEDEGDDGDGEEQSGQPEEVEDDEGEDELREAHRYRSDSVSSQDINIKILHHSLRKQSRGSNAENASEYDLETLHGVAQTLYEEQESLLNSHMNAIQESAELLTEEGQLLAEIQGDSVVDYDIDKYITRLDEILAQKANTIGELREQLVAFRKRCEEEESASKRVDQWPPPSSERDRKAHFDLVQKRYLHTTTTTMMMRMTSAKRASAAVATAGLQWSTRRQSQALAHVGRSGAAHQQHLMATTASAVVQSDGASCSAAAVLQLAHRDQRSQGTSLGQLAAVAAAMAVAATGASTMEPSRAEAPAASDSPPKAEKRYEYAQVVDVIREQVSEFRATLKSSDTRVPKAYPIKKIGISRIHAPNGVSTIRIEFVCPPFIDQEAILGRFLLNLQKSSSTSVGGGESKQSVEVFPVPPEKLEQKSIVEAYEQPSVTYLYANGRGSFQFLRDKTMQPNRGTTFVFYKDEYLTQSEVDAVVGAYKEIYSYPHVHAFFRHDMSQSRRKMLADRGGPKNSGIGNPAGSKDEAIQQLQALGIDVFEVAEGDNCVNWDSLAGYDKVKLEIEDTVVLALQNPELYEEIARKTRCRYESNRPRAVLFEGPPGTGKTLSARIIAQQAGIPMIHIPIESVVSKWYGDSEKKMSAIFDACEKLDGAIIFIDEIDALAGDRSGGTMHEASRRILSVLLQKVEGFSSAKKTTVICATNRKQDLDPALISRFDLCIRYDLPDEDTRKAVFGRYAKQLSSDDLSQLASISAGLSCRDIKEICEYAERKWASKVLKKEETGELPTLLSYMEATKIHTLGIGSNEQSPVYDA